MTRKTTLCISLLLAFVAVSCCSGRRCKNGAPNVDPFAEPVPPLAVDVRAVPADAQIIFRGKPVGETPTAIRLHNLEEVVSLEARREGLTVIERRIKFLAPDRIQVLFRFGDDPSPVAKRLGLTKVVVFDYSEAVSFDSGSSLLKPASLPILYSQSELLKKTFGKLDVYVCGHTDSTGSDALNLRLSLARARSVATVLTEDGVPAGRLKVQGFGKEYPVDTNATPEGRASNRRTELVLPQ